MVYKSIPSHEIALTVDFKNIIQILVTAGPMESWAWQLLSNNFQLSCWKPGLDREETIVSIEAMQANTETAILI